MRTTVTPDPATDEAPFVVGARPLGLRDGLDAGRLSQVADELEAEAFVELSHTLARSIA